jgi:predicted nucleic acid-binding Zn ribbon protein
MFEPFQNLMPKAANRFGISKEIQAAKVCHDFRILVLELFKGKESAEENIQPAHFTKNVLVINVKNQAWAQEVIMRKDKIIEEMNKKAGTQIIKNLRAQLKKI